MTGWRHTMLFHTIANPELGRIVCRVMAHLFAIGDLLGYLRGDDSAEIWRHCFGGSGAQSQLDGAGKTVQAGKLGTIGALHFAGLIRSTLKPLGVSSWTNISDLSFSICALLMEDIMLTS